MALLKTVDGGKLFADADPRTIGPQNCKRRINIRREDDGEILMPGWADYGSLPANCIHLFRAVRPNGDRAALAFTATAIYRRNDSAGTWDLLADGFQPTTYWNAENLDGYVLLNNGRDLIHSWDWETPVAPIKEFREQGIVRVGTIWTAYNFLMMADITEMSQDALVNWMEGDDPYGFVPDSTEGLTRTAHRVAWTDKPLELGLTVRAFARGGDNEIALTFPCGSIKPGDKLNFTETDQDDDDVTVFLTEVEVESVQQNRIRLKDVTISNDSWGIIQRSDYSERIVGYDDLQGDGSPIIWGGLLGKYVIAVRESGILIGQLNESVSSYVQAPPFFFQEVYKGLSAPTSRNLIAYINEDTLFYWSRGSFYQFDFRSQRPQLAKVFDANESLLTGLDEVTSRIAHLPTQQEVWILLSDRTLVMDYGAGLLTEVDAVFTSAALVGDIDRDFLLAEGSNIRRMDENLFTRNGEGYQGVLEYGWSGDTGNMRDIIMRRYIPVGSGSVFVKIDQCVSGQDDPINFFPSKKVGAGIAIQMHIRGQWIRDTIELDSGTAKLTGREVEQQLTENRVRGFGYGS